MNPQDLQGYLQNLNIPDSAKADAWDHYFQAKNAQDFQSRFSKLNIPDSAKADLWDSKYTPGFNLSTPKPSPSTGPNSTVLPPTEGPTIQAHTPTFFENLKDMFRSSIFAYGLRSESSPYVGKRDEQGTVSKILGTPESLVNENAHPIIHGGLESTGNFATIDNASILAATAATGGLVGGVSPLAGKVLGRLVSGGFSAQMLHGLYQKHQAFQEAVNRGDVQTAQRLVGQALVEGPMAGLAASHALTGGGTIGKIQEKVAPRSVEPAPESASVQDRAQSPSANSDGFSVEDKTGGPSAKSVQVDQYTEAQKIVHREGVGSPAIIADDLNIPLSDAANHVARMQQEGILDESRSLVRPPMPGTKAPQVSYVSSEQSAPAKVEDTVSIRPQDFLDKVGGAKNTSPQIVAGYKEDFQNGAPVEPLSITHDKNGNVIDADGRHRALAAVQAGVSRVPVVLKRTEETAEPQTFVSQKRVGDTLQFSVEERKDMHKAQILSLQQELKTAQTPEAKADIQAAIDKHESILTELRGGPPVVRQPSQTKVTSNSRSDTKVFTGKPETSPSSSIAPLVPEVESKTPVNNTSGREAATSSPSTKERNIEASRKLYPPEKLEKLKAATATDAKLSFQESRERLLRTQAQLDLARRAQERGFTRGAKTPEEISSLEQQERDFHQQTLEHFRKTVSTASDKEVEALISKIEEPVYKQIGQAYQLHELYTHDKHAKTLRNILNEDASQAGLSEQSRQLLEQVYFKGEKVGRRLTKGEGGQATRIQYMLGKVELSEQPSVKLLKFIPGGEKGKEMLARVAEAREHIQRMADTAGSPEEKTKFARFNEKRESDLFDEEGNIIARKGEYKYNPILIRQRVRPSPAESSSPFFNAELLPKNGIREITSENVKAILAGENLKSVDRLTSAQKAALESVEGRDRTLLKQEFARERVATLRDSFLRKAQNNVNLIRELKRVRGIEGQTPLEAAVDKLRQDLRSTQEPEIRLANPKLLPSATEDSFKVEGRETAPEGVAEERAKIGSSEAITPSAKESTDIFSQLQEFVNNLKTGKAVDPVLNKRLRETGIIKEGMGNGAIADTLQKYINRQRGAEKAKATKAAKKPVIPTPEPHSPEVQKAMDMISELSQENIDSLIKEAGLPKNAKLIDLAKHVAEKPTEVAKETTPPQPEKPSVPPTTPVGPKEEIAPKAPLTPGEQEVHNRVKGLEGQLAKVGDPDVPTSLKVLQSAVNDIAQSRMDKYLAYERGLKTLVSGYEKNNPWKMLDAVKAIKQPGQIGTIGPSRRTLTPTEIRESYRVYAHSMLDRYERMTDLQQARMAEKINDGVLERAVRESEDPNVLRRFEMLREKAGSLDPITRLGSILVDGRELTAADAGKGIMREKMGFQKLDRVQLRKLLERSASRWDSAKIADSTDFIHAIESGNLSQFSKEDQAIASTLRDLLDNRRVKLQALGKGFLDDYIENYFPHIWSNVGRARDVIRQTILSRRPLEGTGEFLKQREYDSFKAGLSAGLQPVTWNPVKMALIRLEQIDKFVAAHEMAADFKKEGLVQFVRIGGEIPAGWVELKDKIFSANRKDPKTGALMTFGKWYAPKELAIAFNNHLSPGWNGTKAYDVIRTYGNAVNQANLVGGVFHLVESGFNTTVSDLALSLQQFTTKGQRVSGLKSLGRIPVSVIDAYFNSGRKMIAEAAEPGMFAEYARSVDAMAKAGGALQIDPQYLNQSAEKFRTNLKIAIDQDAGLQTRLRAGVKLPLNAAGTILEKTNWFVMEHFVPRMKAAAFHRMVNQIYDKLGPSPDERILRMELQKAWDSVDNRLGELIYDNLFWNRRVKDTALVTFRSTGWNLGTAREIGGGSTDLGKNVVDAFRGKKVELSPRSAYTIALTGAVMGIGATMTYFATGHAPQSLADYFYPQDGTTGPDGKPNRHYLKSYVHDIMGLLHDLPKSAFETIAHKAAPQWSQAWSLLWSNTDFYGTEIRHPGDSTADQLRSAGKYLFDSAKPFFWQNFREETRRDTPMTSRIESLFGILPAPRWAGQSKAEALAYKLAIRNMPTTRSTEEFNRQQEVDKLRNRYAQKKIQVNNLLDAAQKGSIKYSDVRNIAAESDMTPLQRHISRLSPSDAMQVYRIATPEEKQQLAQQMWRKFRQAYTEVETPDKASLIEEYTNALMKKTGQPGGH